jgi:uncharacterized membrane protein YeiB
MINVTLKPWRLDSHKRVSGITGAVHEILDVVCGFALLGVVVFVFYGVGFGLAGRIGIAAATTLAITTFLLQIAISGWWLKRFQFGPAEWAWRCLSYGQWMPIR